MHVKIGWEGGAEWTGMIQDMEKWWAFVNMGMSM